MKKFFNAVGKIMFGMHLWLPIAYSLVFLVIAAISNTIVGSWPFYFIGLALSFAGSLVLVYFLKERNAKGKAKTEEKTVTAKTEEAAPASVRRAEAISSSGYVLADNANFIDVSPQVAAEQNRYAGAMTAQPGSVSDRRDDAASDLRYYGASPTQQLYGDPAQQSAPPQYNSYVTPPNAAPTEPTRSAHDALYSSFSSTPAQQPQEKAAFSPYVQPANVQSENAARLSDYETARTGERETPRIFRMRSDPNLLVYEYSDRFEKYYLKPNGDRVNVGTEYK